MGDRPEPELLRHLRRPEVEHALRLRHVVAATARAFLIDHGFIEVMTPILGPRIDEYSNEQFTVRSSRGDRYWLSQSPQMFKQAVVAAGIERYFQTPHCFRAEASAQRRDQAREFVQIDFELRTDSPLEVREIIEALVQSICNRVGVPCQPPFPALDAVACLEEFATDKPDLRESPEELRFVWVERMPLIERIENGTYIPSHHVFALPERDPASCRDTVELQQLRTHSFDLVLNGIELASGDLRINTRPLLEFVLQLFDRQVEQFEAFLEVLDYGLPPFGGAGLGLDRIVMELAHVDRIADVQPFPRWTA